jgi:hypothetical protein
MKVSEVLIYVTITWRNLENIILSERNQTHKVTSCMALFTISRIRKSTETSGCQGLGRENGGDHFMKLSFLWDDVNVQKLDSSNSCPVMLMSVNYFT